MTKSTITREQAQKIIVAADEVITALAGTNEDVHPDDSKKMCELWDDLNDRHAPPVVVRELASMALAAMDSKPVAEVLSNRPGNDTSTIDRALPVGTQLYRHAQPAPEREQVRSEHAEWSQATFGNVGPVGPLKHLSKEALEAAAEPGDLSEWADMQFLLWDAQRRAGITDEQITQAMIEKLAVNKQRKWPEPKDGEPRLHIKEQPAPVAPAVSDDIGEIRVGRLPTMNQDDYPGLGDWWVQLRIGEDSDEVLARVYGATPQEANNRAEALACRAAMLQTAPAHPFPDKGHRWSYGLIHPENCQCIECRSARLNGGKS
jgi:hypothetical protein